MTQNKIFVISKEELACVIWKNSEAMQHYTKSELMKKNKKFLLDVVKSMDLKSISSTLLEIDNHISDSNKSIFDCDIKRDLLIKEHEYVNCISYTPDNKINYIIKLDTSVELAEDDQLLSAKAIIIEKYKI